MRLMKDTYILFCVTALSALVSFVTGIWIRNILGPEEYGVWLIFSLILTYGYYIHLGILDGFSRDIPRLLGQKQYERVRQVRSVVFTWMIVSACLAVAAAVIMIVLPLSAFETVLAVIAILLVPLQNLVLFHNHLFLTTQQFNVVAIIQLIIGSVQYLLMAFFSLILGIYGLFLGVFVGNIMAIIYSRIRLTYRIKITWNWEIIKEMLSYGIPITFIGILLNIFTTLDRLIIFHFFGTVSVGHYGIITFVYQGIMVLPSVFHQVMYPKISFKYGETREKRALKSIVVNPSIYLSYFSPMVLGTIYFIFPSFVKMFMPQYVDGVGAAKIVIIGMFFLIWATLYAHYLTVVNKQWTYFKILLFAAALNALLNIAFVKFGFHIEGVALGTAISYIIYPISMMWFCFKDMGEPIFDFVKHAVLVFIPFITMVSLLMIISLFPLHFMANLLNYLVCYIIFIVISSNRIPSLITYSREFVHFIKLQVNNYNAKRLK